MQSRIKKQSRKINYDALSKETDKQRGGKGSYVRGPNVRVNFEGNDGPFSERTKLTKLELGNINDIDSGYSDSGKDMKSNSKVSRKRKQSVTGLKNREEIEESEENDESNYESGDASGKKNQKDDSKAGEPISENDEEEYNSEEERLEIERAHQDIGNSVADLYTHEYDGYGSDYEYGSDYD